MRPWIVTGLFLAIAGCASGGGGGTFAFHRVPESPTHDPVVNLTSERRAALPEPVVVALDEAISSGSSSVDVRPGSSWQQAQEILGCHPGYLLYRGALLQCVPSKVYD
jgi:hypothetical protein